MSIALVVDTETTGLPNYSELASHPCQPHLVQLAWVLLDGERIVRAASVIVRPDGWTIPEEATRIHGISQDVAERCGTGLGLALAAFHDALRRADVGVAHNMNFDRRIVESAAHRVGEVMAPLLLLITEMREAKRLRCTMLEGVGAGTGHARRGKWPTLAEAHLHFVGEPLAQAHDALADARACARVWLEMERRRAAAAVSP